MHGVGSLGRIVRGVFAARGAVGDVPGSGAPAAGAASRSRTGASLIALAIAAAALLAFAAPSAFAAKAVVQTIGSTARGTTGGLFNQPRGIAVNKTGNGGVPAGTFYVVDGNNDRLQRFAPDGSFVAAWGGDVIESGAAGDVGKGYEVCTSAVDCKAGAGTSSSGVLNNPQGVAVDQATGAVYVTDQGNSRVDVYSAAGNFEGAFGYGAINGAPSFQFCTTICSRGPAGAAAGQFGAAIGGLAVSPSGDVYVADKSNRRVDVFTPTNSAGVVTSVTFTRSFGWGVDTGAAAFQVCTTASTCQAGATTAPGNNPGQFGTGTTSPADIAFDSSGDVYVLDPANKRVQEFDSTPSLLNASFGSPALAAAFGTGSLYSIAADQEADHIYVAGSASTAANHVRVAELDSSGAAVDVHGTDLDRTSANGLAVDPGSLGGNLFVSSSQATNQVFVLNDTIPSMDPVTVHGADSATFSGTVVSNNVDTRYHFEYATDGVTWTKLPATDADAGSAPTTIAVSQNATGLLASQLYHVRLVEARPAGGIPIASPEVTFTTAAAPPLVSGESASAVGAGSATLNAQVNPQNQPTTWRFEYGDRGPCDSNPCASVPIPNASAGQGNSAVLVSQPIAGLLPATKYHFRVVATNASGSTPGPDATFSTFPATPVFGPCPNDALRTGPSEFLPDCRAYEQVSPVEKGGDIAPLNKAIAPSGDAATYSAFNGPTGSLESQYMSVRTASDWTTQSITPFPDEPNGGAFQGFSSDLSHMVFGRALGLTGYVLYRRDADGSLDLIAPESSSEPKFSGATSDYAKIIFASREDLTSDSQSLPTSSEKVYEWQDGSLTLVSVLPGGTASAGHVPLLANMISADGSRVWWQSGSGRAAAPIYLDSDGTTTLVSADESGAAKSATLLAATPDGSAAYLKSATRLTADARPAGEDLYRYDAESGRLTDLTPGSTEAAVEGLVGATEDGSYVYFVAGGVLASGATAEQPNLYLLHGGTTTFIATLIARQGTSEKDLPVWDATSPWEHSTAAQMTADGRSLVFASVAPLDPGYDNAGHNEVYRYDAGADQLSCLSCKPSGAAASADSILSVANTYRDYRLENGATNAMAAVNNLSGDGSRIFFESSEALVTADTNGQNDVYEWEASGTGSCASTAQSGGCVFLISSGRDGSPSFFEGATPTGEDAFILTRSRLVGQDADDLYDFYDVRAGGGFAAQSRPPAPPPCLGESCRGAGSAPGAPSPSTNSFAGPGNVHSASACSDLGRRARKLAHRAGRLHRRALRLQRHLRRMPASKRAQDLRHKQRRLARRAAHRSQQAKHLRRLNKRCMRADRRTPK